MKQRQLLLGLLIICASIGLITFLTPDTTGLSGTTTSFNTKNEQPTLREGYLHYTNDTYNFALEYPSNLTVKSFLEEDDGETIVFKSEIVGGKLQAFQVYIQPFTEDRITREYILEDIPGIELLNLEEIILGEDTPALLFWSGDDLFGRTREVWFVHEGYLYQVTTLGELDAWLAEIMTTWRFLP